MRLMQFDEISMNCHSIIGLEIAELRFVENGMRERRRKREREKEDVYKANESESETVREKWTKAENSRAKKLETSNNMT